MTGALQLRPATAADAEVLLALTKACDVADIGYVDTDVGDIEADLEEPGGETWIAGDPPLAYASLGADGRAFVSVPPAARGRGIGTTLREQLEARARERGIERVHQYAFGTNDGARSLLAAAGYATDGGSWRMRAELDELAAPPPLPPGIVVGDYAGGEQEERALWSLISAAMATVPGNRPVAFDVWAARFTRRSGFDPTLTLVAHDGDELAGAAVGNRFGDGTGFVDYLAVAPERHGKGLGRALLARLLARFRERGDTIGELNVAAGNQAGLGLYESVGMIAAWRSDSYVKDLAG